MFCEFTIDDLRFTIEQLRERARLDRKPSSPACFRTNNNTFPPHQQSVNRQSSIVTPRGFSLVEIMIVIVIIGLLAGVVTINVRSYLIKAKQNVARQEIANIMHALDSFWAEYNRYPTNEEGLEILIRPTEKNPEPLLTGREAPRDPWDREYLYNSPGSSGPYEVISLGADGREGGEGADADITSDKLKE